MENIGFHLLKATEEAAIAAREWFGKGDKNSADGAAVEAMRKELSKIPFSAEVALCEGEKDEAPMIAPGEKFGSGEGEVDLAIDPLECTTYCSQGRGNSISVISAASKGSLLKVPETRMYQIIVGPSAKGAIDITKSFEENVLSISEKLEKSPGEMTFYLLEKPRHQDFIDVLRKFGAKIIISEHGSISGGIATCIPNSGIDVFVGIDRSIEAIITAVAVKALGGDMQGMIVPRDEDSDRLAEKMGLLNKPLTLGDMVKSDENVFVATGISEGFFLGGIEKTENNLITNSVLIHNGKINYLRRVHK